MEKCEELRHTRGNKDLYDKRKETIERLFGTAKEHHGFRYTNMKGKAKMEMKVSLTFACLNLKKLAKLLDKKYGNDPTFFDLLRNFIIFFPFYKNSPFLMKKASCLT